MKKAIPVSSNLASRGIQSFVCKRCGGIEDDLHVFVTCPFAAEVWQLSPLTWIPEAALPSMAHLLTLNTRMITLPPVGIYVPLWPWLLWNLWKFRNKLYFDDRSFTAQEVVNKAITDAREWQAAQIVEQRSSLTTSQVATSRSPLITPPSGPLCYVDAAWSSDTGTCGIGGIFKNTSPTLPEIKFSQHSISSALMAEAIAIRSAVMKAASSNLRSLTVLSDSKVLITMLKTKTSRPALFGILFDIFYFSSVLDSVSFLFIPRLQNLEADGVAKSALAMIVVNPSAEG